MTLYTFIREENPKDAGRILKNLDEDLLKELIKLMLKVSAGHEKSEQDLSLAMIQDIQLLAKIRDRAFINKVLLPLIENEVTIPISLYETDLDIITGKNEASAPVDDAGEDVAAKS